MNTQVTPLSALPGLSEWCNDQSFDLEDVHPGQTLIVDREAGRHWSLQRIEAWLQVKGWILPGIASAQAISVTLANLHDRALGCRFAIDEDNNLCVLTDLFPHDQSGAAVGAVITQMQWVVDATHGLLRRVQETGVAAGEHAIDEAFMRDGPVVLH